MDAVGSNIRVDARGREVLRILPRNNDAVNEEWISDKTRFVADGLRTQRLDRPYIRKNGRLEPASWDEALGLGRRQARRPPSRSASPPSPAISPAPRRCSRSATCSCASARATSTAARTAPSSTRASAGPATCSTRPSRASSGPTPSCSSAPIRASRPPSLNVRIRKRWRQGGFAVGLIGERADLTYPYDYLGAGPQTLKEVADGKHGFADGSARGQAAAW